MVSSDCICGMGGDGAVSASKNKCVLGLTLGLRLGFGVWARVGVSSECVPLAQSRSRKTTARCSSRACALWPTARPRGWVFWRTPRAFCASARRSTRVWRSTPPAPFCLCGCAVRVNTTTQSPPRAAMAQGLACAGAGVGDVGAHAQLLAGRPVGGQGRHASGEGCIATKNVG